MLFRINPITKETGLNMIGNEKTCIHCKIEIPKSRLEALPHTETCVKCSTEKSYIGFMDWHHKTAPELVLVCPSNSENVRRATAIHKRKR